MNDAEDISSEGGYMLLHTVGGYLDDDLSNHPVLQIYPSPVPERVFQLNDGRVMLVAPSLPGFDHTIKRHWAREEGMIGSVLVYNSRGDFDRILDELPYTEEVFSEVYAAVQPYGESFPDHVAELCQLLPERLRLPAGALDGTLWTLNALDEALARFAQASNGPHPAMGTRTFGPLIAYLGEIVRVAFQGEWRMRFEQNRQVDPDEYPDAMIWVPHIVANGYIREEDMFYRLQEYLLEHVEYPTAHVVIGCLWSTLTEQERRRSYTLIGLPENYGDNGFE